MQIIPLRSLPAQSLTFTRDGRRWEVTIKVAQRAMVADIRVDDVELMRGGRIAPGTPVLPYRYLSTLGNLLFLTVGDADPDWTRFEADQTLLYVSPSEYPSLVAQRVLDRVGAPLSAVQSVTTVRAGRIERDPLGGPDRLFDDQGNAVLSVRRLDGVMSHGWQGDVPLFSRVRSNLLQYSGNASRPPWAGTDNVERVYFPAAPSIGGTVGATWVSRPDSAGWLFEQRMPSPVLRPGTITIFAAPLQPVGGRIRVYLLVPGSEFDFFAEADLFTRNFRGVTGFSEARMAPLLSLPGCTQLTLAWDRAPAAGAYMLITSENPNYLLSDWFFYAAHIDDSGTEPGIYFPTESAPLTRVDYGFQSGELRVNWDDTLFTSATWSGSGLIWGAAE